MKVPFPVEDSLLMTDLNKAYAVRSDCLTFIPMGDSAYSYKVYCEDGQKYYLKLFDHRNERQRKGVEQLNRYLPLTWELYAEGLLRNISYPIKNRNGDFHTTLNGLTVVLFNFIEGETLAEAHPFSGAILERIAAFVAVLQQATPRIHSRTLLTETFDMSFETKLTACISELELTPVLDNHSKQTLQQLLLSRKEEILYYLNTLRTLRQLAISNPKAKVLCHGDLWGGNLIHKGNELYVIDWESTILAPPEFELVRFIGEEFDVFLSAYEQSSGKSIPISPDLLRFYSYRHHLRNLTNWATNILYHNKEEAQNENDLEMILHHCMNRWGSVESNVKCVMALQKRK